MCTIYNCLPGTCCNVLSEVMNWELCIVCQKKTSEAVRCPLKVIQKTANRFSAMPIDQAHEQNNALVKGNLVEQQTPSPEENSWTLDEETKSWRPVLTTLPVASKACTELVKCSCRSVKGCGARCSCNKANWKCTELCKCNCNK